MQCEFQTLYITAIPAYHHLEVAWLCHKLQVAVIELKHVCVDIESDITAFACLQGDALKALQLLDRPADGCCQITDIELNNLVGIILAGVLHIDSETEFAAGIHRRAAQSRFAIFKRGVAKSESERIERVIAHIDIVALIFAILFRSLRYRASRVQMIIINRYLSESLWHSHGEMTRRRLLAEYHIADGIVYFISKGKSPIYDQFAHRALDALEGGLKPKAQEVPKHTVPGKNSKNAFKWFKDNYAERLKGMFGAHYKERKLDRALWVYGHLFKASD